MVTGEGSSKLPMVDTYNHRGLPCYTVCNNTYLPTRTSQGFLHCNSILQWMGHSSVPLFLSFLLHLLTTLTLAMAPVVGFATPLEQLYYITIVRKNN